MSLFVCDAHGKKTCCLSLVLLLQDEFCPWSCQCRWLSGSVWLWDSKYRSGWIPASQSAAHCIITDTFFDWEPFKMSSGKTNDCNGQTTNRQTNTWELVVFRKLFIISLFSPVSFFHFKMKTSKCQCVFLVIELLSFFSSFPLLIHVFLTQVCLPEAALHSTV